MENSIIINVTYTLKDFKEYAYAKSYPTTIGRLFYLILGIILPVFFTIITLVATIFIKDTDSFIILLSTIPLAILSAIVHSSFLVNYLIIKNNFNKSKILRIPQRFVFDEDKFELSSPNGNSSFLWSDIFKIKELKPCFVIYTSPMTYFLLPRRCINSTSQLELLRNIFKQKIEKRKLSLKKYPLGKVSVDKEIGTYNEAEQNTKIIQEDQPLLEFEFSLTKEELLAANFRSFYTKPVGIIMTVLGLLLFVGYITSLFSNERSPIIRLIVGLFFIAYPPINLYFITQKYFKNNASLRKAFIYKIYNNFFVITSEMNKNRILWSDVIKVTENKSTFMIFVTKYIAHLIPKRVFEEDEEKIIMFKKILKQQNKL